MKEEFDVNLTPQDMYRFNMYHTSVSYTHLTLPTIA